MLAVLRPLTEKEREVQEEIERRFFKPLLLKHLEGMELREYWQTMKQDSVDYDMKGVLVLCMCFSVYIRV